MSIHNLKIITKMAFDKNVLKSLIEIYNILKEDKQFNLLKYIKMMRSMLKGEKIVKHQDQYILSTFLPPFPSQSFIQNILAVDEPINIFTKQIYAQRTAPISMYLCITNKCPNNCIYCSAKNRKEEKELSKEEWMKVIEEIQDMKTPIIGITGGEPLVHEDIFDMIEAIDSRSTIILFTSGFNLSYEKAKKLKDSGLFGIGISLDSYDKDTHNKNRNSEKAFDYALDALRNANKAGLYTMAQTVILKENLEEKKLFKLFKLAKDNGAHEVKILEPILSGSLLTEKQLDNVFYSERDRQKLIEIQHRANKISSLPKISTFAYTESEAKFGCGAGNQHSYISATGELYPCDFVPMSFGNVKKESIKKLWVEMHNSIGKPKIGCFAQKVNKEVFKKSEGRLPLNKEKAICICSQNKSNKYPKYYRDLQ
ncbi:radical SAM/SPASM domain-containing protein [Inediibacterium massiliense]|uniref:radical SAM/SPASM domain-containing protein n=1 Tax=Inediibacterium massiliense TaxID=1658111 RepID=UPI0006B69A83|nr:radical SAM protein [Inediibacterium massiliense]